MLQIIYASRPFGFDASVLSAILAHARVHNTLHDITGALICRSDLYLQMIEGPPDAIEGLYEKIKRDDRHIEVTTLVERQIRFRMFPEWAMRDDPLKSWMWTRDEVSSGNVFKASEGEALSVFVRLIGGRPQIVPD